MANESMIAPKRGRKSSKPGNRALTYDQLVRMYEKQKPMIEAQALSTVGIKRRSGRIDNVRKEEFKHCIDKSCGGNYYCPEYVVSNFGRIWKLEKGQFVGQGRSKTDEGYFQINVLTTAKEFNHGSTVRVHRLVAHYFVDPDHEQRDVMMRLYNITDENKLFVHHKMIFDTMHDDYSVNIDTNLQFIPRSVHAGLHDIAKIYRQYVDNIRGVTDENELERLYEERNKALGNLKIVKTKLGGIDHFQAQFFSSYGETKGITNPYNQLIVTYSKKETEDGLTYYSERITPKLCFDKNRPSWLPEPILEPKPVGRKSRQTKPNR